MEKRCIARGISCVVDGHHDAGFFLFETCTGCYWSLFLIFPAGVKSATSVNVTMGRNIARVTESPVPPFHKKSLDRYSYSSRFHLTRRDSSQLSIVQQEK